MKIPSQFSAHFERDWKFYLKEIENIQPTVYGVTDDVNGLTAKQCFWLRDTHGKTQERPCSEHKLYLQALAVKERVNLTCEMQAEDLVDMLIYPSELEEWRKDAPKWVLESIFRQAKKMMKGRYIPTFLLTYIEKYVK